MTEITVKDRRPKMPGCARASAMLRLHCKIVPYVHQADGLAAMLERFERFGSFGLLHDMGCGKTLTMLGGFLTLADEGRSRMMLVVCPMSVIGAWEKEAAGITARGGTDIDVLALTQDGVKKRVKALEEWLRLRSLNRQMGEVVPPGIVVVNYEATWRMEHELRAAGFDIDVCDESQRIKAAGAKQSLALYRIGKSQSLVRHDAWEATRQLALARSLRMPAPDNLSAFRVIMSGTPVPEGGLDWYGQFRFLDPTVLGTNFNNFKQKFATEIDCGTFRKVIVNPHTMPELEARVMERVHRVSKEEAVDLPEQTHVVHEFEMHPKQRRIYDDLVRDSVAFVDALKAQRAGGLGFQDQMAMMEQLASVDMGDEIIGDNVLTRMLRLLQICGGYMQISGRDHVEPCVVERRSGKADKIINPKLEVLAELMETLRDAGDKLVIAHRFTHEGMAIADLAQRMSGKKRPVSIINGSIPSRDRARMVSEFQDGDADFFVGQIQACAEGITLNAACNGAIYSSPFASAIFQQFLARYHRIGQTRPVTHHHLIAARSMDGSVYDSQMRKHDAAIDHVDGGWGKFLRGETDGDHGFAA